MHRSKKKDNTLINPKEYSVIILQKNLSQAIISNDKILEIYNKNSTIKTPKKLP